MNNNSIQQKGNTMTTGMAHSFLITIEQFGVDSVVNNIFTSEIESNAFASGLFKGNMYGYPSVDINPTKLFVLKSYGAIDLGELASKPQMDSHICTIITDNNGYIYLHNVHHAYVDLISDMPEVNVTEQECEEQFGDLYKKSPILRSFLEAFAPTHFKDGFIDLANSYYLYLKEYKSYMDRISALNESFCIGSIHGVKYSYTNAVHMNIMSLVLMEKVLSKFNS